MILIFSILSYSCQDLQHEIAEKRTALQALNATGELMIAGLNGNNAEVLREQMAEMNQRWNKLYSNSMEARRHALLTVNYYKFN